MEGFCLGSNDTVSRHSSEYQPTTNPTTKTPSQTQSFFPPKWQEGSSKSKKANKSLFTATLDKIKERHREQQKINDTLYEVIVIPQERKTEDIDVALLIVSPTQTKSTSIGPCPTPPARKIRNLGRTITPPPRSRRNSGRSITPPPRKRRDSARSTPSPVPHLQFLPLTGDSTPTVAEDSVIPVHIAPNRPCPHDPSKPPIPPARTPSKNRKKSQREGLKIVNPDNTVILREETKSELVEVKSVVMLAACNEYLVRNHTQPTDTQEVKSIPGDSSPANSSEKESAKDDHIVLDIESNVNVMEASQNTNYSDDISTRGISTKDRQVDISGQRHANNQIRMDTASGSGMCRNMNVNFNFSSTSQNKSQTVELSTKKMGNKAGCASFQQPNEALQQIDKRTFSSSMSSFAEEPNVCITDDNDNEVTVKAYQAGKMKQNINAPAPQHLVIMDPCHITENVHSKNCPINQEHNRYHATDTQNTCIGNSQNSTIMKPQELQTVHPEYPRISVYDNHFPNCTYNEEDPSRISNSSINMSGNPNMEGNFLTLDSQDNDPSVMTKVNSNEHVNHHNSEEIPNNMTDNDTAPKIHELASPAEKINLPTSKKLSTTKKLTSDDSRQEMPENKYQQESACSNLSRMERVRVSLEKLDLPSWYYPKPQADISPFRSGSPFWRGSRPISPVSLHGSWRDRSLPSSPIRNRSLPSSPIRDRSLPNSPTSSPLPPRSLGGTRLKEKLDKGTRTGEINCYIGWRSQEKLPTFFPTTCPSRIEEARRSSLSMTCS